jgi:hypothetical protein
MNSWLETPESKSSKRKKLERLKVSKELRFKNMTTKKLINQQSSKTSMPRIPWPLLLMPTTSTLDSVLPVTMVMMMLHLPVEEEEVAEEEEVEEETPMVVEEEELEDKTQSKPLRKPKTISQLYERDDLLSKIKRVG